MFIYVQKAKLIIIAAVNIKYLAKNNYSSMRKLNISLLLVAIATMSGCQVIGGIFKAGMAVGIIAILIVVFLIIWLVSAFRK